MFSDFSCPTLPTIETVQKWIKKEMALLGLEWDTTSAKLDAQTMMQNMIRDTANAADFEGKFHFQLLADGVSCYRHMSACNVGLKMFNNCPNFNSLTSMKML